MNFVNNKFVKLVNQTITESKDLYPIYHKSYSDAITAIIEYVRKRGFEIDEESLHSEVTVGPGKPHSGETHRIDLVLTKDGKKVEKQLLHAQVYNTGKSFELNMYIN